jgi:hypothetical protein
MDSSDDFNGVPSGKEVSGYFGWLPKDMIHYIFLILIVSDSADVEQPSKWMDDERRVRRMIASTEGAFSGDPRRRRVHPASWRMYWLWKLCEVNKWFKKQVIMYRDFLIGQEALKLVHERKFPKKMIIAQSYYQKIYRDECKKERSRSKLELISSHIAERMFTLLYNDFINGRNPGAWRLILELNEPIHGVSVLECWNSVSKKEKEGMIAKLCGNVNLHLGELIAYAIHWKETTVAAEIVKLKSICGHGSGCKAFRCRTIVFKFRVL